MKKRTKYLIARLGIMALCVVIGFGIGWISKETEVVEVNIEKPIVRVNQPIEEKETEPTPTYKEMQIVATAYCPCVKCCGKSDGITATGIKAKANHTIAADPKVLPYGTEILCGMGEFVVEDCGGNIKGNRVDFFFDSHEEAVSFGRQEFSIWVKENKK
jgi:3D (Asp-Asp-Asp) domain-containing protein